MQHLSGDVNCFSQIARNLSTIIFNYDLYGCLNCARILLTSQSVYSIIDNKLARQELEEKEKPQVVIFSVGANDLSLIALIVTLGQ